MLFTKDYPEAYGARPETRLTITSQTSSMTAVTLYTCLGADDGQHRHIHVQVLTTPGAAFVDIADELIVAAVQERAVAVTRVRKNFEPIAFAPAGHLGKPPDLFDAAGWAKSHDSVLALPAREPAPSLARVPLTGLPGEWHLFIVR